MIVFVFAFWWLVLLCAVAGTFIGKVIWEALHGRSLESVEKLHGHLG